MKAGIIGLPGSGKTTLFRALTRGVYSTENFQSGRANVGVIHVPDSRVDFLAREYNPKKVTYASIEFVDGAAQVSHEDGRARFGSGFFADLRQVDALVVVVRGFVGSLGEEPSPGSDLSRINDELLLADLASVETRMERVEKQLHGVKKGVTTPATIEMDLLSRIRSTLEQGLPISTLELAEDEAKSVRGYDFLSLKPLIAVLNVPESEISSLSGLGESFLQECRGRGVRAVALCAQVEMEISELGSDEESEFLQSMGIAEPARNVLIRECYSALGLISFITAGPPEVRAWTLKAGSTAIDAAAAIHSDLARGFIRAEIANASVVESAGGWESAKQKGLTELHGKDYVVRDGDVIYVRFKV